MAGMCCGIVGETEAATVTSNPIPKKTRRSRLNVQCSLTVLASPSSDPVPEDEKAAGSRRKRAKLDEPKRSDADVHKCEKPELVKQDKFGMTSVCGRRRDMEDAVSIHSSFTRGGDFSFFGIFDGHGCSHVAMRCRDRLHEIVQAEIDTAVSPIRWTDLMERSFVAMDRDVEAWAGTASDVKPSICRCEMHATQCDAVGSTAVIAVVARESIVVSNCGDSRAVLCRNGVAFPLSTDHKPDRPDELHRIESAGGRVIFWDGARVFGVLGMSRAIGDNYLKPYVIPLPEVTVTERAEDDECLIIASDGLWDVVSNEMACEVARMCLKAGRSSCSTSNTKQSSGSDKACSDASILLTKLALARQSSDNVSVVVIDLQRPV